MKERKKTPTKSFVLFFFLLTNGKTTSQFQIAEKIFLQIKAKLSPFFIRLTLVVPNHLQHSTHKLKLIELKLI